MNILKKIYETENKNLKGDLLNILFVYKGIRPAFLFESANYKNNEFTIRDFYNVIKEINNLDDLIQLRTKENDSTFIQIFVYLTDDSRRLVNEELYDVDKRISLNPDIVNIDVEIAKILNFYCIGHDYGNAYKTRLSIQVFITTDPDMSKDAYRDADTSEDINIISEVCDINLINIDDIKSKYNDLTNKINVLLQNLNDEYNTYRSFFQFFRDDGMFILFENLQNKNKEYLIENKKDYLDTLENYYISDLNLLKNTMTYAKFNDIENTINNINDYNILIYIFRNVICNVYYKRFYQNANTFDKNNKVSEKLVEFDNEIWKNNSRIKNCINYLLSVEDNLCNHINHILNIKTDGIKKSRSIKKRKNKKSKSIKKRKSKKSRSIQKK